MPSWSSEQLFSRRQPAEFCPQTSNFLPLGNKNWPLAGENVREVVREVCKTGRLLARGGRTLLALIVSGIALLGSSPKASPSDFARQRSVTGQEENLVDAINRVRVARGVPPLRVGPRLQRAARAHSRAMARSGSLTHGSWYQRLRSFGVRGRMVGENIAWGAGSDASPSAIVGMWLASPPHRATMLTRGFRRIGVGIAVGSMAGFSGASFATADFSS